MPDLILFDLDLTLMDRSAFRRWAVAFAAERSLPAAAVDLLVEADDLGRASRYEVFSALLEAHALPEDVDQLIASYRSGYPEHITPDPLILRALGRLKEAGWLLGVVTNGPVPDTAANRAKDGQPLSNGGRSTPPAGN